MSEQENLVRFLANQEMPYTDAMALQIAFQSSLDAVVQEALGLGEAFTGLNVTAPSATDVTVATGRYWKDGPRYRLDEAQTLSLLSFIPSVGLQRAISIGVTGSVVDDIADIRRFRISSSPTEAVFQPQTTNTRTRRKAVLAVFAGPLGTGEILATVPPGYLEIARLVLTETGIAGTPEMQTANQLESLASTQTALAALQVLLDRNASLIESQRSDISSLVGELRQRATKTDMIMLARAVAVINERLHLPDDYIDFGIDDALSEDESDIANPDYDAVTDVDGVHFPIDDAKNQAVALLNPTDPAVTLHNGVLMMPTYRLENGLGGASQTNTIRPADNTTASWTVKENDLGRQYYFFGRGQNRAELLANLGDAQSVRLFDPATNDWETVSLRDKTWSINNDFHDAGFVRIFVSDYPNDKQTTSTYTGSAIAQSFLNGRLGWLKRINIAVTQKAATGSITALICPLLPSGEPDLDNVRRSTTVAVDDIRVWPLETNLDFAAPVLLQNGERYAIVIITAGAHVLGMSSTHRVFNGNLMQAANGSRFTALPNFDLTAALYFMLFDNSQTVVSLESLDLSGGIENIDLMFYGAEPSGTKLVLQGQIAGVWRSFDHTDLAALNANPNLIPLRLVFNGTPQVMPALGLSNSRIIGWRMKTAVTHISTARTLPSPAGRVVVDRALRDYDPDHHTFDVKLLTGVGYATVVTADAVTVTPLPGAPRQSAAEASFTLSPTVSAYKIKCVGGTDTAGIGYRMLARKDWARPAA